MASHRITECGQQKSKKFSAQQTAQSRVKAEIITKYFALRSKIISGAGATKIIYINLWAGRGRYGELNAAYQPRAPCAPSAACAYSADCRQAWATGS